MSARDWRTIGVDAPRERRPLPPWIGRAIPPLLPPLAAMAWVAADWDRIAYRFGPGGEALWNARTPRRAFSLLLFGEGLVVLLLALMLISWYGSRKSMSRSPVEKILLAVTYMISLVLTAVGLVQTARVPAWPLAVVIPLATLGLMIYVIRQQAQPGEATDETPNECWSLGGIYYNPADPALFVRSRLGTGFTLNMANRWSCWFQTGLLAGTALLAGFLWWSMR